MFVGIISLPSSITSQIPPGTSELWPLNFPKLGFLLSKSKSFHPIFFKLGENVGVHNISTKFYNQPNPPGTSKLWPLNCPKELAVSYFQVEYPAPKNVVITIEFTTNTTGIFCVSLALLFSYNLQSTKDFLLIIIMTAVMKCTLSVYLRNSNSGMV